MKDLVLLIGRAITGLLIAGHGAQKLFGWFEGPGLTQFNSMTESMMGMRPGRFWGTMQAAGETGGGALTTLGFLNPLGPITIVASMIAAAYKGHWGKPVWAAKGGPELSLAFLAGAAVVAAGGPGRLSLDSMLGVRVPRWITALSVLTSAGMIAETIHPTISPQLFPPQSSPADES